MRQRNKIEAMLTIAHMKKLADYLIESAVGQEPLDGKFAHGYDQFWFQNLNLAVEPTGAILDFLGGRHAITAGFFFAGETAADRGHVDAAPELLLG